MSVRQQPLHLHTIEPIAQRSLGINAVAETLLAQLDAAEHRIRRMSHIASEAAIGKLP